MKVFEGPTPLHEVDMLNINVSPTKSPKPKVRGVEEDVSESALQLGFGLWCPFFRERDWGFNSGEICVIWAKKHILYSTIIKEVEKRNQAYSLC